MDGASLNEAGHNTDPQAEFCSINNRLQCYREQKRWNSMLKQNEL